MPDLCMVACFTMSRNAMPAVQAFDDLAGLRSTGERDLVLLMRRVTVIHEAHANVHATPSHARRYCREFRPGSTLATISGVK